MKVTAILKGKPDQFNRLPIVIRINDGEKRSYITTRFRIEKGRFRNGQTDDPVINDMLKKIVIDKEKDRLDGVTRKKDMDFFAYAEKCLKEWGAVRAYGTMKKYKSEIKKLKDFRSSCKLSQLNADLLRDYSLHCYQKGNAPNTVWTTFRVLRTIILKAKRERLIAESPFDIFRMPVYRDPQKRFLTKDEVLSLEKYLPKSGNLRLCATWFVIGCYTGLRYGDMNAFDKEKHIRAGRLVLYTSKTGEVVSMPVGKKVKKLFESIGYQSLFISNQKYNSALKKIAEANKLGDLTGHISRHTFGCLCAASGISQEVCAKLMGHRDLKTTAIYYKLANPRIDKEVERLWE